MQIRRGKVRKFLRGPAGEVNGFVLDRGLDIRFPSKESSRVQATTTIGSRVEVHGRMRHGSTIDSYLDAAVIVNRDSKRTVNLLVTSTLNNPMVSAAMTVDSAASLEPLEQKDLEKIESRHSQTCVTSNAQLQRENALSTPALRNDAATEIEHAYSKLHCTQAILAYLKVMKQQPPRIGRFLDEARHNYEKALSRYEERDFQGAQELGASSSFLSRVVEIVVFRTLRSDAANLTLVPPPPRRTGLVDDSSQIQDGLNEVESLLSWIHWLMENGALPAEDRTRIWKIAAWSEALYGQARRMFRRGEMEDATELAEAANAAAQSAEHMCRKWYGTESNSPSMISPVQSLQR
jgi:hypothetical protein